MTAHKPQAQLHDRHHRIRANYMTATAAADSATASKRRPLLETRGLSVDFGGLHALDGLDLQVHEGEIVSVIGPNGAGKTTLFNAISATVEVASGDIVFEGESLMGSGPQPGHHQRHRPHLPERKAVRQHDRARERHGLPALPNPPARLRRAVLHPSIPPRGNRDPPASPEQVLSLLRVAGWWDTASTSPPSPCPTPTGADSKSREPWPPNPS